MFYFRNGRNRGYGGGCGRTGQSPGFGSPPCSSCPAPGRPQPSPQPACPPEHGHGKKEDGGKHHDKDKKEWDAKEHEHREDGKKEEKRAERKEEHQKHDVREDKGRAEEKKRQCTKIQPCACNSCQCTFNCPDLLRWALWSSGFFRCNQCEKSGWHHRIGGGSGFC